jgi:acid phosphatase type 7
MESQSCSKLFTGRLPDSEVDDAGKSPGAALRSAELQLERQRKWVTMTLSHGMNCHWSRSKYGLWCVAMVVCQLTARGAQLTRGPYLQTGTPTSVVVRWRTDVNTDSQVRYGTNVNNLNRNVIDTIQTEEHEVAVSGLRPNTKYYYAIGGNTQTFAIGPDFFFVTSPTNARATRIWVLGDAGTQTFDQEAVRDSYYAFGAGRHTDLWLMLGDNAYGSGTDSQYQRGVFDMYPEILRTSVLWPTIGNHDTYSFDVNGEYPYLKIFSLPTAGQAGGTPSGTEKYYSFNYGTIHFVVLDSMTSDRSSQGLMCSWLATDLTENTNQWVLAFWHHPPYTKGSHDSDDPFGFDFELVEMRENVLPILESFGVDLVLCGHSHSYERSFFLHGHYGFSWEFDAETMVLDPGSGREFETGGYEKEQEHGPGTVYVVAGSSGQTSGGALNHPAMFISLDQLGSLVLDVNGTRLDAGFLAADGTITDSFTLLKPGLRIRSFNVTAGMMTLTWSAEPGKTYYVERTKSLETPEWEIISPAIRAAGPTASWSSLIEPDQSLFYRVADFSN